MALCGVVTDFLAGNWASTPPPWGSGWNVKVYYPLAFCRLLILRFVKNVPRLVVTHQRVVRGAHGIDPMWSHTMTRVSGLP